MANQDDLEAQRISVNLKSLKVPPARPDTEPNVYRRQISGVMRRSPRSGQSHLVWVAITMLFLMQCYIAWRLHELEANAATTAETSE